ALLQEYRQRGAVLDGLIGALAKVWEHGMGCVAQQRQTSVHPLAEWLAIVESPPEAGLYFIKQSRYAWIPAFERGCEFVAIANGRPGFHRLVLGWYETDVVEQLSPTYWKHHEMLPITHPDLVGFPAPIR